MSLKNAIGGIALLAGTAIGAAVLALPVATAHLGFVQTTLIYLCAWLFMTLGALYLLEANLYVGYGTNLITMAEKTLGKSGKFLTWVVYLILLYALTAAYLNGVGAWVMKGLSALNQQYAWDLTLSPLTSALVATVPAMLVILLGTALTDWVNRFLMIGLISAFIALLTATSQHIDTHLLFEQSTTFDVRPIPLIITAFGSAIVIPSLTEYLHGKPKQLLAVVLIGSAIPLLVYILWESAILGIIPLQGQLGLIEIQQHGHPVTDIPLALENLLHQPWISTASSYFSIFALLTSLLGVCLSLFDFLADGLHHLHSKLRDRLLLILITFLPPLGFIAFFPQGFSFALSFAGIFVAILLGILPATMVWQGRYHQGIKAPLRIPGGKTMLVITIIFFLAVTLVEGFNQYEAIWGSPV